MPVTTACVFDRETHADRVPTQSTLLAHLELLDVEVDDYRNLLLDGYRGLRNPDDTTGVGRCEGHRRRADREVGGRVIADGNRPVLRIGRSGRGQPSRNLRIGGRHRGGPLRHRQTQRRWRVHDRRGVGVIDRCRGGRRARSTDGVGGAEGHRCRPKGEVSRRVITNRQTAVFGIIGSRRGEPALKVSGTFFSSGQTERTPKDFIVV
jgi:hypothetical protein